jgi:hypothetical protein
LRELNEVGELLLENLRNVGSNRIRPDRHSHGYGAATERTGCYADVGTATLAVGYLSNIVDGCNRRAQKDFEIESVAILGDAIVHVVDVLNGVSEDGSPFWNVADVREYIIKPSRLYMRYEPRS